MMDQSFRCVYSGCQKNVERRSEDCANVQANLNLHWARKLTVRFLFIMSFRRSQPHRYYDVHLMDYYICQFDYEI